MLLKLEGFWYATSIDLNMGYYYIPFSDNTSNLCTIILPLGKYCYKHLPMGIAYSQEIFQQKMNDLFRKFDFFCTYIDDLLILTKEYWTNYVCDAIYIGNTQHTFRTIMYGHFSDVHSLLMNRQKSDSFAAHF